MTGIQASKTKTWEICKHFTNLCLDTEVTKLKFPNLPSKIATVEVVQNHFRDVASWNPWDVAKVMLRGKLQAIKRTHHF